MWRMLQTSSAKAKWTFGNIPHNINILDLTFWLRQPTVIVIVDYYTLWPEVYQLKKTDSNAVIQAIRRCLSRHGIPQESVTDNGSQ